MTFTTRTLIVAATLALLSACSSAPRKIEGTPAGVSYSYDKGEDLALVTDKAMRFCSEQGKVAKLENVGKNDGEPVAMFGCV